jgi:hypothetical protein
LYAPGPPKAALVCGDSFIRWLQMFGNEEAGIAVPKVAKVKGICDLIGERFNARELVKVCASVKHLKPVRKGKLNKSLPVGYFNAASIRN